MKTIRFQFLFLLVLAATWSSSQNVTLSIGGLITQLPSLQPSPFHTVLVTVYPDPSNPDLTILDSTYTNIIGVYETNVVIPWFPGIAVPFTVSTFDCQENLHQQSFEYTGTSLQYGISFNICGDSLIPQECSNYFSFVGSTGLAVTLWGNMVNQQTAVYSWNFGDGTIGNGAYVTHIFPTQGTYSVTMNTLTSDSCADVTIQTVTVYDTVTPSTCDNYISIINTTGLTVSMYGGMNNHQRAFYLWSFGDGSGSSDVYALHTYPGPGTYLISLTTNTVDSCQDVTTLSITLNDSVTPPSNCDNYINVSEIQGLWVSLDAGMVNPQSATYSWDFGDGMSGTGSLITHTYAIDGAYTLSLTTITSDSCTDVTTRSITVTDSVSGCSSHFTASAGLNPYIVHFQGFHQPQIPASFSWDYGDQNSGNGQTIDHSYTAEGTYMVVLTSIDSSGCTSQFSAPVFVYYFNTFTLKGRVLADNQPINNCRVQLFKQETSGNMTLIKEASIDSANFYNFSAVPSGIYRILAVPDPGMYNARYLPTYFNNGYLWEDATVVMLGYPANTYDIHLVSYDSVVGGIGAITGMINTAGKTTILTNQEVLLLNAADIPVRCTVTNGQGNYMFSTLPYGDYKVYPNITGITTFPVSVNLNPSSAISNVNMAVKGTSITGMPGELSKIILRDVYPNPVSSFLSIEIDSRLKEDFRIEILDASGRIVVQNQYNYADHHQLLRLDLSNLATGLYILRLTDSRNNSANRKFLKN
jgi:hypothetical protein